MYKFWAPRCITFPVV